MARALGSLVKLVPRLLLHSQTVPFPTRQVPVCTNQGKDKRSHALPQYTYCITTNTTQSAAVRRYYRVLKRACRPKRRDPHPVPPLREGQEAKTRLVQNAEHDEQRMTTDHKQNIDAHHQHRTGRTQAPLWHEDDFVSGHVQTAIQYWKETILTVHPQRDEFRGYIGGVRLSEFIDSMSAGIFEGSPFKGADVPSIELPNHVPASHDGWVNDEIQSLVQKGSLAAWSTAADTKTQLRPRICLPLGVEPNKPRLIWDARCLNSMCKHSPFQMDGVGKVAQCSWKEA